jgi:hypothetical protein
VRGATERAIARATALGIGRASWRRDPLPLVTAKRPGERRTCPRVCHEFLKIAHCQGRPGRSYIASKYLRSLWGSHGVVEAEGQRGARCAA